MEHETALPEDGDGGITRDGMLLFLCVWQNMRVEWMTKEILVD